MTGKTNLENVQHAACLLSHLESYAITVIKDFIWNLKWFACVIGQQRSHYQGITGLYLFQTLTLQVRSLTRESGTIPRVELIQIPVGKKHFQNALRFH